METVSQAVSELSYVAAQRTILFTATPVRASNSTKQNFTAVKTSDPTKLNVEGSSAKQIDTL
jgi:hypothetical protein